MTQKVYALGIDVGSTTVKTVVINEQNEILSHCYQRHMSRVRETVLEQIQALRKQFPDVLFKIYVERSINHVAIQIKVCAVMGFGGWSCAESTMVHQA